MEALASSCSGSLAMNSTMLEAFEWYAPADQSHWRRLRKALPGLKAIGIDSMWIPPGCKAGSDQSNGYDVYDLYDLGEFDQKGSRATKWGTKEELSELTDAAHENGVGICWDAVLNHRAKGDYKEHCQAVKVDPTDRRKEIGQPEEVEVWTGFNFPARHGQYSCMDYHWYHFSGIDWDSRSNTKGIFKFLGDGKPGWASDVDDELGNYDYLMFADVDYSNQDVRQDVLKWAEWLTSEIQISAIRFDAIKHFSIQFLQTLIQHLDRTSNEKNPPLFFVGEYWKADLEVLGTLIQKMDGRMSLFDVQLVHNLHALSLLGPIGDLRLAFVDTLAKHYPQNAVNHDTQEGQALAAPVALWFTSLAYALILLRANNGLPCVFYGDLYGIQGPNPRPPACSGMLPKFILARKLFAYGKQRDYWGDPACIGWTRHGHNSVSDGAGLAVVMTNGMTARQKRMHVGHQHARERWTDILRNDSIPVVIDGSGWATFEVGPKSVGIWIDSAAKNRDLLDELVFDEDIYQQS